MSVTNFHTIDDQIVAETSGGTTKNYVADALGSVTGVSQGGSTSGAARYSPYGRTIAGSSGALGGWVWSRGYYPTGRTYASHYVRARTFDSSRGRWVSVDAYWPLEPAYAYAQGSPCTFFDPTGKDPNCYAVSLSRWPIASYHLVEASGTNYNVLLLVAVKFRCDVFCHPHDPDDCCQIEKPFFRLDQWVTGFDRLGGSVAIYKHQYESLDVCDGPYQNLCRFWAYFGDAPGVSNSFLLEPGWTLILKFQNLKPSEFPVDVNYGFETCCSIPPGENQPCQQRVYWGVQIRCSGPKSSLCFSRFTQV